MSTNLCSGPFSFTCRHPSRSSHQDLESRSHACSTAKDIQIPVQITSTAILVGFDSMQKTLDLPTELWMDTLKMLHFDDLKTISLACKRFRAFAAPHLFRCVCVSTVVSGKGTFYWSCLRTDPSEPLTLSTMDQLLKFYERITHFVREFGLIQYFYDHPIEPSMNAILALLRRLPRLEKINFRLASLDIHVMHAVEQLPALTSISVLVSGVPWPFTIDPDSLECLSIEHCGPPAVSCLPNLRTLFIDTHDVPSVFCFVDFLMSCSCPFLEALELSSSNQEYEFPANIDRLPTIPCLQKFEGPTRLAPVVATGGSLLHVILLEEGGTLPTVDVLHELQPLAPNLVSLAIDVLYANESALRVAFSFLHLEELFIQSNANEEISFQACKLHQPASQSTHRLISLISPMYRTSSHSFADWGFPQICTASDSNRIFLTAP
jgi:hypothetical protein